jgi:hypothetical protein
MDSYQPIFDQAYASLDSDDPEIINDYGRLVYALEAVFKAAGYGISGQELAGAQHDRIVGSIGQTDLTTIARAYLGWVKVPHAHDLPYPVKRILQGEVSPGLDDLAHIPTIAAEQRFRWQLVFEGWLKAGKIRRNTGRYRSLITQQASEALIPFRQAAITAIEEREKKLLELQAGAEDDHARAEGLAANLRRTATIVEAFCMVSAAIDERGKSLDLPRLAEQIERAVEVRRKLIESHLGQRYRVDQVVSASFVYYPDLAALWEKALELEEAAAPNAPVELEIESNSILGPGWTDTSVAMVEEMVEKGTAPPRPIPSSGCGEGSSFSRPWAH